MPGFSMSTFDVSQSEFQKKDHYILLSLFPPRPASFMKSRYIFRVNSPKMFLQEEKPGLYFNEEGDSGEFAQERYGLTTLFGVAVQSPMVYPYQWDVQKQDLYAYTSHGLLWRKALEYRTDLREGVHLPASFLQNLKQKQGPLLSDLLEEGLHWFCLMEHLGQSELRANPLLGYVLSCVRNFRRTGTLPWRVSTELHLYLSAFVQQGIFQRLTLPNDLLEKQLLDATELCDIVPLVVEKLLRTPVG